jgi:hypothetical protein
LFREANMVAPSRSITPAEQLEMIKRMDENNNKKSADDCTEPSKQDLKVCFHSRYLVKNLLYTGTANRIYSPVFKHFSLSFSALSFLHNQRCT